MLRRLGPSAAGRSAGSQARLERLGRLQRLDRAFLPNFLFGPEDTVVMPGQNGLVAKTLKYLDRQPALGVNPDSGRWNGALLPFDVEAIGEAVRAVLAGAMACRRVTMARARLSDGQSLHAVNGLFIGRRTSGGRRRTSTSPCANRFRAATRRRGSCSARSPASGR